MSQAKKSTIIASSVAFSLAIVKVFVAVFTGSVAVLSSAIDSLLDFFVSVFNFFAVKNAEKPADAKFNYGRGKIEGLAAFLEGLIISLSGLFIIYESVTKFIRGEELSFLLPAMYVMIFSVIVTFILVQYLQSVAKKTGNLVIEADSIHYGMDLYTNIGILLSLLAVHFSGWYWIDYLVGFGLGIFIIYSAYEILRKGFLMIIDVALDEECVEKIKDILEKEKTLESYHYLKTRMSGDTIFVQAHLVFKDERIPLYEAHRISDNLECRVVAVKPEHKWIIDFHLDPYDDEHHDEENRVCRM